MQLISSKVIIRMRYFYFESKQLKKTEGIFSIADCDTTENPNELSLLAHILKFPTIFRVKKVILRENRKTREICWKKCGSDGLSKNIAEENSF